jgi:hypothetical protein
MQPTVSLSTTEAEYRVLTDVAKDILYFCKLLDELGMTSNGATGFLSDNQSYIKLVLHSRTKHTISNIILLEKFQKQEIYK